MLKYAYKEKNYKAQVSVNTKKNVKNLKTVYLKKKKTVKKTSFFSRLITVLLLSSIAYFVSFSVIQHCIQPLFKTLFPAKPLYVDYNSMLNKATNIAYNDSFLGQKMLVNVKSKKQFMQALYENTELTPLTKKLITLMKSYPSINAAVYVWDFETGDYVDIDADKIYSAASIIKIPVLLQLFKSIELGQLSIKDTMKLTAEYRAEGSGDLQFKAENSVYTYDELARVMMRDSDNSATNMIMSSLGGMSDINRALRNWGLKNTKVQTWLPDMDGTNYTTAKDLATMLLNVDNSSFLEVTSREFVIDYMSNIRNNRLIHAGLPKEALFLHKTGDIGKMLGDAGIVYAPNGKKYIVVILVNRPYNAPEGKEFIVNASSLIYKTLVN